MGNVLKRTVLGQVLQNSKYSIAILQGSVAACIAARVEPQQSLTIQMRHETSENQKCFGNPACFKTALAVCLDLILPSTTK